MISERQCYADDRIGVMAAENSALTLTRINHI